MVDVSKTRVVIVHCEQCGKHVALFHPLQPHVELRVVDPENTAQEKTCPNCQTKANYQATLWEEVELP